MKIEYMSIDIESFSSVDLKTSGVYRYSESPDFEILLLGYSVNGGPVKTVDIASGEEVPMEIIEAIAGDDVIKWAFNASFERICLSSWLKKHYPSLFHGYGTGDDYIDYLSPTSWRCSMVWSAYLGLPLSLAGVGKILKLDEQKMTEGKSLITYFCCPCAPTKSNGGRTRNLPHHDTEKWSTFKSYNIRDVEVEMAIQKKLSNHPVPDMVWEEYHIDQTINDRGILVDMILVENAIKFDEVSRSSIIEKLQHITGVENPNSVSQMKTWLSDKGVETETLGKKTVQSLISETEGEIRDALVLRLQCAKSSIKKYQSMKNTVCKDNRARGMFQFYGANRTGRWCLTGDHEVLTKHGWVRLDEWEGGGIACWNARNEIVSFQKANSLSFDYMGPMYTYKDCRIDQCSTPDHKMRVGRKYSGHWEDMTVEEMAKTSPIIPLTGFKDYRCCADPVLLRVLIMTQADGHYTPDGEVTFHFKKLRKVERCKMLLRKAQLFFLVRENSDGSTSIDIPARSVPLWLRQFRDKTFGYWLFDENPDIFFDELPHWDGYYPAPNSIQYSTINKTNADIVQALAHLSGRTAIIHKKKVSNKNPSWNDAYVVDIWQNAVNAHEITAKPTVTDYRGKVYCAETPTGYFLVRRNGKVWVTGNSGRHIQLQNLRQNHLSDINGTRDLVKSGDYEMMSMLYDDIPDTLSQLVRTAFVPRRGYKFIVSDFSAIEARVLAWLGGEQWVLDVFSSGGDIYCETASRMFGVPVVKHGINGELRQKGKQATLSCIAEGELVLTDRGLVPIEEVTLDDKVWDGEKLVEHEGVVFKGERDVVTYEGLTATPDHLVYVEGKNAPLPFSDAIMVGAHLVKSGETRKDSRTVIKAKVYDILNAGPRHRFTVSGHLVHNCGYGGGVGALKAMGAIEAGMKEEELKPLVDAWRSANPNIVKFWWEMDAAVRRVIRERTSVKVRCITLEYRGGMMFMRLPSGRMLSYVKPKLGENVEGTEVITYEGIGNTKKWERVESYGPKFVENATQAISRDILAYAMRTLQDMKVVAHVHDELIIECPMETEVEDVSIAMATLPPWVPGLCLRADGDEMKFYQEA